MLRRRGSRQVVADCAVVLSSSAASYSRRQRDATKPKGIEAESARVPPVSCHGVARQECCSTCIHFCDRRSWTPDTAISARCFCQCPATRMLWVCWAGGGSVTYMSTLSVRGHTQVTGAHYSSSRFVTWVHGPVHEDWTRRDPGGVCQGVDGIVSGGASSWLWMTRTPGSSAAPLWRQSASCCLRRCAWLTAEGCVRAPLELSRRPSHLEAVPSVFN